MMDKIISEELFYDDDDDEDEDGQKSAVFELYKLDKETKRYELKEISDTDSNDENGIIYGVSQKVSCTLVISHNGSLPTLMCKCF